MSQPPKSPHLSITPIGSVVGGGIFLLWVLFSFGAGLHELLECGKSIDARKFLCQEVAKPLSNLGWYALLGTFFGIPLLVIVEGATFFTAKTTKAPSVPKDDQPKP